MASRRPSRDSKRLLAGAVIALVAVGFVACAASSAQSGAEGGTCVGLSCGPNDAGHDQVVADVIVPDQASDSEAAALNALCGSGCLPDDSTACPSGSAGSIGGASGQNGSAGAGGASGAAGSAGAAGAEPVDASLDADAGTTAPDAETDAQPPAQIMGCGVTRDSHGLPLSQCVPAGDGEPGSPCVSAADCRPGLACVGDGNAAQCRPYCCGDPDSCEKGLYCAEKKQKAADPTETPLMIPVCVPADNCSLDEPFPCPTGKTCKCGEGTACTVVRDDGTTSCVPPGTGHASDPCPCASGYVCSQATTTCLKLCSTNSSTPECGSGTCVSVAYLPDGYGVCGL